MVPLPLVPTKLPLAAALPADARTLALIPPLEPRVLFPVSDFPRPI